MIVRFKELQELLKSVLVDVEKKIVSESEDFKRVNLSSSLSDFRHEDNILHFQIGNSPFTITGEILLFSESIYFLTRRKDDESKRLSFLVKLKKEKNGDDLLYIKDSSYYLNEGLTHYVEMLFLDIENREKNVLNSFKPIEVVIN